ncbi:MAG: prefoldin subunit alpha [Candidatus Aenigmatarchaeota archaeon]
MSDDLQQKMVRFQVLEMNLSVVRKKYEEVLKSMEELEVSRATMEGLKHLKPSEALIPVGANNYICGKVEGAEDIMVWIGGGVVLKKKRSEAIRVIGDRVKELNGIADELAKQEHHILAELQKLQPEIERISQGR